MSNQSQSAFSSFRVINHLLAAFLLLHANQTQLRAEEQAPVVECLGSPNATEKLVYLHGFEKPEAWSPEESSNREVLLELSKQRSMRIALPLSPFLCKNQQRCWASKSEEETLATFATIQKAVTKCWADGENKSYSLLGFSNGGYFAFKIYKLHRDQRLKHIIGVGSSGTWDASQDRLSPISKFSLIIGRKEITLPSAKKFEKELQKSMKDFRIILSPGGHRLDLKSLLSVIPQDSKDP